ncbi:toprim domain-containing protein [Aureimonas psammosilenae]|uniref:toprim domain-containing protein n=1 Tax=Aureimonas psammosilenae TaxID=2495496 RepID=UPI001F1720CC|nr:toprim domain-containing protein [Aureimonas psammosilenae]
MLREPLKDRALGRWRGILPAIGVPAKALSNRHGPCPMCGGKDRFRFDDKGGRGTWICSKCGAGDGIELVKLFQGVEFREAAQLIEAQIDAAPVIGAKGQQPQTDGQKREEMRTLWQRSKPITKADVAGKYLHERIGRTEFSPALRFSPDERYAEAGRKSSWHPAMIAKVDPCDAAAKNGERAALHRTYLDALGGKADVPSPRKMMGAMPTGAAVRLMPFTDVLGIAEGIETALSASVLFDVPCWAALTAGLMQEWQPPEGVGTIMVFGDNDASNTGQAAAYQLAARLKAKGLSVFVEIPPRQGDDWNDVHRAKLEAA